ncbi:hypothetical protein D1007_30316 [Hordeum vulgare]|nr:hypothetical protein D1007_30316 [Hordeum vulgare]
MSPVSSFSSLCRHRVIRCTARLGCDPPATPARFVALDRPRSLSSSGQLRRGAKEGMLLRWFRETTNTSSCSGGGGGAGGTGRPAAGFSTWARLAIGSAAAVKWASFLRIQNEVEMVKDAAETAAEVVEEVATAAEKVSSEVVGHLPEEGRLRRAAVMVEHASKEVAEEAHRARDIIHKVVPLPFEFSCKLKQLHFFGRLEVK